MGDLSDLPECNSHGRDFVKECPRCRFIMEYGKDKLPPLPEGASRLFITIKHEANLRQISVSLDGENVPTDEEADENDTTIRQMAWLLKQKINAVIEEFYQDYARYCKEKNLEN
jgi:hypothetical protein